MTSQNEITCWLVINKWSWWFYTSLQMSRVSRWLHYDVTWWLITMQWRWWLHRDETSPNDDHRRFTRWRENENIYLLISTQQSPWIHNKVIKWWLFERNRRIKVITFWFTVVCDTRGHLWYHSDDTTPDYVKPTDTMIYICYTYYDDLYATPAVYIIKFIPINFRLQRLAFCFYHLIYRHQSIRIDFNNMERKRMFVWYELRCSL